MTAARGQQRKPSQFLVFKKKEQMRGVGRRGIGSSVPRKVARTWAMAVGLMDKALWGL